MSYKFLLSLLAFSLLNINTLAQNIDDGFSCESVIRNHDIPKIYLDTVNFSAENKIKTFFILDESDDPMQLDCVEYNYHTTIQYACRFYDGLDEYDLPTILRAHENRDATLHAVVGVTRWMLDYGIYESINMKCELGERQNIDNYYL